MVFGTVGDVVQVADHTLMEGCEVDQVLVRYIEAFVVGFYAYCAYVGLGNPYPEGFF
jgi:hypothetical protein